MGYKQARRNPYAVALEYTPPDYAAPRVTARGRGELADRIISAARQAGVPIREDRDLVELLLQLDMNECIPPELYRAVAEILVFIYGLNEQWKETHGLTRSPEP
jgi:flagellar biosynthesis protein